MTLLQILYISAITLIITSSVSIIMLATQAFEALKETKRILSDVKSTTRDIREVKETMKSGIPTLIGKTLVAITGGDNK